MPCRIFSAMHFDPQPLVFTPVYKHRIWGGRRLASAYGRQIPTGDIGESWEISDRPDGMSLVASGPLKGISLHELCAIFPEKVIGNHFDDKKFPLLVKILDARERLSLQVHPDADCARAQKAEPKTEMWYILQAEPCSLIYAGLKKDTSPQTLTQAIVNGTVVDLLGMFPAFPHRSLFIPAGMVHAIGAGCMLLEIQQNSDTTYRLYDWGRLGQDGKPRQVHQEKAIQAIKWNVGIPNIIEPSSSMGVEADIVTCQFFRVSNILLDRSITIMHDGTTFSVIFVAEGSLEVESSFPVTLNAGNTCLLPAALPSFRLVPKEPLVRIVRATLPPAGNANRA